MEKKRQKIDTDKIENHGIQKILLVYLKSYLLETLTKHETFKGNPQSSSISKLYIWLKSYDSVKCESPRLNGKSKHKIL